MTASNGHPQSLVKGVTFMWAGFGLLPLMDVSAKELIHQGMEPAFVAWWRFVLSALILLPVVFGRGHGSAIWGPGSRLQIFRALMITAATVLFFSALETMPLADALAVYFVYPFLMTLMAAVFLGEIVRARRLTAILIGFSGSLLVIRPGFEEIPVGVFYVLVASVCFAAFNVITRKLSGVSDPWFTVFYQSLVGAIVLIVVLPFQWQTPTFAQWGVLALMVSAAVIAHWLIIRAFDYASASQLAPLGYAEIVSAAILAYFWFGDFPDALTWAGIGVIMSAGVYMALRERKLDQP